MPWKNAPKFELSVEQLCELPLVRGRDGRTVPSMSVGLRPQARGLGQPLHPYPTPGSSKDCSIYNSNNEGGQG